MDSTAHGGIPFSSHSHMDLPTSQQGLSTVDCSCQTNSATSEQTMSMIDLSSHLVSLIQNHATGEGDLGEDVVNVEIWGYGDVWRSCVEVRMWKVRML